MARIFITGSADGLGQLAAKQLIQQGHHVTLHARNAARGKDALQKTPGAEGILIADLSNMEAVKALAAQANDTGSFDAIIHNAGVYRESAVTPEGLPILLTVNTLAPYVLTALMHKPKRLIYLTSGMHLSGDPNLNNLQAGPGVSSRISYSDTKLHDVILSMAVARRYPDIYSNAVNPGWVPTKMGGAGAPDSLEEGYATQVWLAASDDPHATVSGKYFHHKKQARAHQSAANPAIQDQLIAICEKITGVSLT